MKFSSSIDINRPLETVTALFADPENLKHYQEGFVRKEIVEGSPGADGAIAKMHYNNGGREMILTETVISNRLPNSFEAVYSHPMMDNTMRCEFTPLSEAKTRYAIDVEYTAIRGLAPKIMAMLFPGVFTRQGKKWMENFKAFVEKN